MRILRYAIDIAQGISFFRPVSSNVLRLGVLHFYYFTVRVPAAVLKYATGMLNNRSVLRLDPTL